MSTLIDTDIVSLALPPQSLADRFERSKRLNEALIRRAMKAQDCGLLISTVTGSAHSANDITNCSFLQLWS